MNVNLREVNEAFLEDRLIDLLYMRSCGIQQVLKETVSSSAGLLAQISFSPGINQVHRYFYKNSQSRAVTVIVGVLVDVSIYVYFKPMSMVSCWCILKSSK